MIDDYRMASNLYQKEYISKYIFNKISKEIFKRMHTESQKFISIDFLTKEEKEELKHITVSI